MVVRLVFVCVVALGLTLGATSSALAHTVFNEGFTYQTSNGQLYLPTL